MSQPDLGMSVSITRALLSLPDLAINDFVNYYVSPSFLGAAVQWSRNQVGSPFLDGQVTTFRTRQMVQEQVVVEVLADTVAEMQANIITLEEAFIQDNYNLAVAIGTTKWQFQCEAADYQEAWTGPRFLSKQGQVTFTMPRQPVLILGGPD